MLSEGADFFYWWDKKKMDALRCKDGWMDGWMSVVIVSEGQSWGMRPAYQTSCSGDLRVIGQSHLGDKRGFVFNTD